MKKIVSVLILLSMVFGITAFQCSSTEMTSARLYIQQKDYKKATVALNKEIAKNPKNDEALYLLGFIQGEQGNIEDMLTSYKKSMVISNKWKKNIEDSKKYYWASNFNKGVSLFNRASKVADKDSMDMFFDKAISSFNTAILCQPDSVDTYRNLTFAYMNSGRNDKAIAPLKKIISLDATADSYNMLGQIYLDKGTELEAKFEESKSKEDSIAAVAEYDKAIEVLKEGKTTFPDDSNLLLLLSNAYIGADKLDVAMDAFKEGVDKDPSNKFYRYNYGVLLLGAEKFEQAAAQFNKAIEIDPEYVNGIYNLAVTYVKWGAKLREEAEANEDYENKEYLNEFKLALPHLEKYLEFNPEESVIWNLLGQVYANLGMNDKSKEAFDKADLYK